MKPILDVDHYDPNHGSRGGIGMYVTLDLQEAISKVIQFII